LDGSSAGWRWGQPRRNTGSRWISRLSSLFSPQPERPRTATYEIRFGRDRFTTRVADRHLVTERFIFSGGGAADDMSCLTREFISRHRPTTAPNGESDPGMTIRRRSEKNCGAVASVTHGVVPDHSHAPAVIGSSSWPARQTNSSQLLNPDPPDEQSVWNW
jgi:hypothetical protein